jgi:hypothetical protein
MVGHHTWRWVGSRVIVVCCTLNQHAVQCRVVVDARVDTSLFNPYRSANMLPCTQQLMSRRACPFLDQITGLVESTHNEGLSAQQTRQDKTQDYTGQHTASTTGRSTRMACAPQMRKERLADKKLRPGQKSPSDHAWPKSVAEFCE